MALLYILRLIRRISYPSFIQPAPGFRHVVCSESFFLWAEIHDLSPFSTRRLFSREATFSFVGIAFADVISDADKGKSRLVENGLKFALTTDADTLPKPVTISVSIDRTKILTRPTNFSQSFKSWYNQRLNDSRISSKTYHRIRAWKQPWCQQRCWVVVRVLVLMLVLVVVKMGVLVHLVAFRVRGMRLQKTVV